MENKTSSMLIVTFLVTQLIAIACSGTSRSSNEKAKLPSAVASPSSSNSVVSTPAVDARNSKHLEGNASPTFPSGEPNTIAIVAQAGDLDMSRSLPIVVRNNTSVSVTRVTVAGTIRDAEGALLASGSDQGFTPNVVPPGEIAIGYVFFDYDSKLPKGWKVEFQTSGTPSDKVRFENIRDLDVIEYNQVGKRIVGSLSNPHTETVTGPIGVDLTCFDKEGKPLSHHIDYAKPDTLAPNGRTSFQIELFNSPCPIFLFGGSGFTQ